MANGKVKRLVRDRGFGFIQDGRGEDWFFHRSALAHGTDFDTLTENQAVTFDEGQGDKGPRAERVRLA